ncbi:MAG: murein biosynthesis integral membrane protein MurJ [Actinomycetota bacterium]|nr:murein biosynthesis integral membrane protein MurJ [Actinomycetota bacterium]
MSAGAGAGGGTGAGPEASGGDPGAGGFQAAAGFAATTDDLVRATGVMAIGTLLSRGTGLLRTVATVYALGFAGVSGDYNLANTIPNMVVDLLLGGVLAATFIPVFVQRLASRTEDEAWDAISAVVSVAVVAIAAASVLFLVAAPLVVDVLTGLGSGAHGGADRRLATDLLVLFVPQLTCYGLIALATAVLNARRRFAAPMFVPIINNVVLIAVLVAFRQLVGPAVVGASGGAQALLAHRGWLLLLGVGTTLGVVVQAIALIPALRGADLHLHWNPRFRHESVRTVVRLSGWTFGLVVANQVALTVVLALSEAIGPRAVSAYTYAWQFFQLPFGVVAVSVMSATAPELAERWTLHDLEGFRRRLATGLRAILAVMVPAAAGMVILARPAVELLGHLTHQAGSAGTAQALSVLALGLPGFCVFLYAIRVLQSIQDMRSAFWLYALENGINIVLAVALYRPLGVRGIAASIAAAYTVAAVVALARVRREVDGLGGDLIGGALRRIGVASVVLVVAAAAGVDVSGSQTGPALLGRLVLGVAAGTVGYLGTMAVAALVSRRRRLVVPARHRPGANTEDETGTAVGSTADHRSSGAVPGPVGASGEGSSADAGGGLGGGRPTSRAARTRGRVPPGLPVPLAPAGRPPSRPTGLGPLRRGGAGGSAPEQDVDPGAGPGAGPGAAPPADG